MNLSDWYTLLEPLLRVGAYLAGALMLGMAAIGAALGVGNLGNSYLQAIARQPELLPALRTQMFIVLGLIDAIPMMAVGIGMYIIFAGSTYVPFEL